ncbi:MAG TPA: bifunctional phosphoglucose/phosphomannose isomerase [Candidatus Saccharimonadales bacterium]|nr:bifunctional phosphoglucose/phosphomannose isomerase [Candidatus Saccharimonadales bacterium]
MLDDLKYIHQRDGQDALGIAERQASQLEYKFEWPAHSGDYQNIVFAGMGGSALPALLSRSWPGYKLPFEVCRQYDIPAYVSGKTLFIAASYSGNTEETLTALGQAEERGASIAVIAGGGKLEEVAQAKNYLYMKIPKAEQPRYAVFYMLVALVNILEAADLLNEREVSAQLAQASQYLKEAVKGWVATVPQEKNPAKQLAMELAGKSGVIYGGPLMAPVAYKWKINFNENAKNVAWWGQYPEFNHNEFIGWSSHPVDKPYGVVDLRSSFENPRIRQRFELSDKLLSGRRPAAHVVEAQGETLLEQLLWAVNFGDFVTIYLALLNGVNPAPVDLVEKFKQELNT